MKDSYYFSHDYNSRNDTKLQEVLMRFGMEGIGLFWCIVEMMYEEGGKLRLDKCDSYAFALRTDTNVLRQIIDVCFECDVTYFWSNSINERLQKRIDKSEKARESVMARWNKKDTNVLRQEYDSNTIKERKGKERKENKYNNVDKITKEVVKEIADDLSVYENDVVRQLEYLKNYIESKGKTYKNYKATLKNWVMKGIDDGKIKVKYKKPANSILELLEQKERQYADNKSSN